MVNIKELAEQLKMRTEWQEVPRPIQNEEYRDYVMDGIKQLFILTSRASAYSDNLIIEETGSEGVYAEYFNYPFTIDEIEYILLSAQIIFFQKVQTMVNARVSYTTNAFSVTKADKPYQNIDETINNLKKERAIIHYKMAYAM